MTFKIVISHSSQDEPWVKVFVDFLKITMEISAEEIYCTSIDGTIPTGSNFKEHIKENIEGAELVLFVFSENYFNSYFCLAELGAAWIIKKNIYPVIIPPLDHKILNNTPLQDPQYIQLNSDRDLMQLVDEFTNQSIPNYEIPAALLNDYCKDYYEKLSEAESQIKIEKTKNISKEQYEKLLEEHKKANETLKRMKEKISNLETMNEDLKEAKGKEDVRRIEEKHSTDWGYFEELRDTANDNLKSLEQIVQSTIFYDLRNEVFYPLINTSEASEAKKLEKRGKIKIDSDGEGLQLNYRYKDISEAVDAVQELDSFIKRREDVLEEIFEEKYGVPLIFKNADFWKEVFDIDIVDSEV